MATHSRKYDLDDMMTVLVAIPDFIEVTECDAIVINIVAFNSASLDYVLNSNLQALSIIDNELSNVLTKSDNCDPDTKFQTINLILIDAAEAIRAHASKDFKRMETCIEAVTKLLSSLKA